MRGCGVCPEAAYQILTSTPTTKYLCFYFTSPACTTMEIQFGRKRGKKEGGLMCKTALVCKKINICKWGNMCECEDLFLKLTDGTSGREGEQGEFLPWLAKRDHWFHSSLAETQQTECQSIGSLLPSLRLFPLTHHSLYISSFPRTQYFLLAQ